MEQNDPKFDFSRNHAAVKLAALLICRAAAILTALSALVGVLR